MVSYADTFSSKQKPIRPVMGLKNSLINLHVRCCLQCEIITKAISKSQPSVARQFKPEIWRKRKVSNLVSSNSIHINQ